MYIRGLATLVVLGGAGVLSKAFTADVVELLAVAAIALAAAAWVIDRFTSL